MSHRPNKGARAFQLWKSCQRKRAYESEDSTKQLIDTALILEDLTRNASVHAAGVVIAPGPLVEYAPLQLDPKGGKIITQYDMYSLTDEYGGVGLLKFDFLGIRNLAILAHSVELVKKLRGVNIEAFYCIGASEDGRRIAHKLGF